MPEYKQIAVLMGGPSAERAVSLNSGRAVADALRSVRYQVTAVDVTSTQLDLPPDVEAVFIALHGTFGEDGQVQAILRERSIPYTGAGVEASRLTFDKVASKRCFEAHDLPTPAWEVLTAESTRSLPLPVIVKPACQGSSVGIHRVRSEESWQRAVNDAAQFGEHILVEAYIEGRELTVGMVDNEVFPVLEICAPDGCYDYRAKYTPGITDYKVPAPISEACAQTCQALAQSAFKALNGRDLLRVDFRMNPAGELFILEANTIPGFTATSLLPKSAQAAGIEFAELCDRIMRMASVH